MAHLPQDNVGNDLPPASPKSNISQQMQRLSINTPSSTRNQPPSPQALSPARPRTQHNNSSFGQSSTQPQSPLRRSPSTTSLDARASRASTPTLLRKASMNSLREARGVTPSRERTPSRASPSRRSSSASFVNGSSMVGKSPLTELEDVVEPPRHTAESIARNHFKKDLKLHDREEGKTPDTIVILHDSCYGHRYSRPRTSRASLSTIVERPERIHASIIGLSVAYVRLGGRHMEGQYPLRPSRDPASTSTTPFRIRKTTRRLSLSSQAVANVHGVKWMEELKIMCDNAEQRLAMNGKELARPDITRSPDQEAPIKFHEGDLYLCSESLNAMEGAMGAVCEGVDAVFQGSANGTGPHRAFVAIRPPGHHCSASYPSGFCWVNNVHVGLSHAALAHGLTHAAIIDFDLHHGDGSQAIAWEHNRRATTLAKNALPWKKTSIGYFSLHDINSYPCEGGDEEKVKNASLCIENAHGQSIWNVHLQPWKSETEFWELYETKYSVLLEKTRNFLRTQTDRLRLLSNGTKPKAAIFLSAGFDASEWESSGMQRHKVNVPTEFYARLTRDVVRIAAEEGTAVDGRIISVLEGGYSDRALCSGVFSHLSGLAGGIPTAIQKELSPNGLGYEMGQKIGAFNGVEGPVIEPSSPWAKRYDSQWWSLSELEKLEILVNPPPPPPEPKKPREGSAPTFSSPTQSFINKVTSPRVQRNVSGLGNGSPQTVTRGPSPPPPEVPWTIASHELSKLLIPVDRQTMSCRPEDLAAEATRARRDRQSILTPPTTAPSEQGDQAPRMALRVRKPAKPSIESVEEDDPKKLTARRKTVTGAAAVTVGEKRSTSANYSQPTRQPNRRSSMASNAGSFTSEAPTRLNGHKRIPPTATAPKRPGSAQSIRPDSSMSSRGQSIPPIAVAKIKAPPQPRRGKKSVLGDTGGAVKNDGTAAPALTKPAIPRGRVKSTLSGATREGTALPASTTQVVSQTSDMDSLTTGMKKITLSLVTKEQKEARAKAKKAVVSAPGTAPARSSPNATKTVLGSSSNASAPQTKPEPVPSTVEPPMPSEIPDSQGPESFAYVPSTPQQLPSQLPPHLVPYLQQATAASKIPLPARLPAATSQAEPAPHPSTDIFIAYQPEGPPPDAMPQQESLRWLPPNTSTPSPMKREQLPIFTATSAIPFGVNPAARPTPQSHEHGELQAPKFDQSVWDVPVTPKK